MFRAFKLGESDFLGPKDGRHDTNGNIEKKSFYLNAWCISLLNEKLLHNYIKLYIKFINIAV